MKVKIMFSNTHAGQGLRQGGLLRVAKNVNPDVLCVVEVQRPSARRRLRNQFPAALWGIHGLYPPALSAAAAGNHVLWRRRAFRQVDGERDLISRQLWNGPIRDKWHPSRRLSTAYLQAVPRPEHTRKPLLAVGCSHLWTTAGHSWSEPYDRVVRGHRKQAERFAAAAGRAQDEGFRTVDVGDYNAFIDNNMTELSFIEQMMKREDMRRVSDNIDHHLDAAFASDNVKVEDFWWIPEGQLTSDHPGFVLVVSI